MLDARKDIGVFEKGTFPYKGNVCKTKEKKSEEKSKDESEENKSEKIKMTIKKLLNILRMNQRVLTMICLKIILIS